MNILRKTKFGASSSLMQSMSKQQTTWWRRWQPPCRRAPRSSNIAQGLEGVRDICLETTATFHIRLWCGADKLSPPPTVYNCLTWICQGKKTLENAARSHVTLHLTNRVDLYEIPGKMMLKMTKISKYIVIPVVSLPKNSLVVLKSDKSW